MISTKRYPRRNGIIRDSLQANDDTYFYVLLVLKADALVYSSYMSLAGVIIWKLEGQAGYERNREYTFHSTISFCGLFFLVQ